MKINGTPRALLRAYEDRSTVPDGRTPQEVRNGFERMFREKGMSRTEARREVSALAEAVDTSRILRASSDVVAGAPDTVAMASLIASLRG